MHVVPRCVAYYWQVLQAGCLPPPRPLQLRCLTLSGLAPGSAAGLSLAVTVHGAAPCFSAAPPCACSTPLLPSSASSRRGRGVGGRSMSSSSGGGGAAMSRSPSTGCLDAATDTSAAVVAAGGASSRRIPRTSSWSVGIGAGGSSPSSRQSQGPRVWTFHGPAAFAGSLGEWQAWLCKGSGNRRGTAAVHHTDCFCVLFGSVAECLRALVMSRPLRSTTRCHCKALPVV